MRDLRSVLLLPAVRRLPRGPQLSPHLTGRAECEIVFGPGVAAAPDGPSGGQVTIDPLSGGRTFTMSPHEDLDLSVTLDFYGLSIDCDDPAISLDVARHLDIHDWLLDG